MRNQLRKVSDLLQDVAKFWFVTSILLLGLSKASEPRDQIASNRRLILPNEPFNYSQPVLPKHVSSVADLYDNQPDDNVITDAGATLGRVLFYDKSLSLNGKVACASCHLQTNAFTDPRVKSIGFKGREVRRHSMSLVNLRYYRRGKFFWDERAGSLEKQVLMPISDKIEMGHDINVLVNDLQKDPIYPPLFDSAFGEDRVTRIRIAKALAQFVRSIISFQSPFDIGLDSVASVNEPFPNFSEQENLGKVQFFGRARCAECHLPNNLSVGNDRGQFAFFQLDQPSVNGIDSESPNVDRGVGEHTDNRLDDGKFKASSLRNIELTAPYMHDGRFRTLDQVIEHYNWSVRPHRNLDQRLNDFSANGMALPEVEKVALTAFLKTLTDPALISDPKYSNPFSGK